MYLYKISPGTVQREDRNLPSTYIQNPDSMLKMTYNCVFLVARKPGKSHAASPQPEVGLGVDPAVYGQQTSQTELTKSVDNPLEKWS